MIRIPLGPSGKPAAWATIDDEDYERIVIHRWYLAGRGYAFRSQNGKSVFMHREVLDFPDSEAINHINGDPLDNRRANLEACTHQHNVRVGATAYVFRAKDEIRRLRLDGWTNIAIAKHLGTSPSRISKYAADLPRAPHPSHKWTRERLIEVVQSFHTDHGRLPTGTDFDGRDGLPMFTQIYRAFPGGIRELREAAGFGPVDLRQTRHRKEKVA